MSRKKQRAIFNLNNIILSSYNKDTQLSNILISENNDMQNKVDEVSVEKYNKILGGETVFFPDEIEEPALAKALYLYKNQKYSLAFYEFIRLLKKHPDNLELMKSASHCLLKLKEFRLILKHFIPRLIEYINEDSEILNIVAGTYFGMPEYYKDAIPLYERLVEKYKDEKLGFNYRLAFLYERVYQDKELDKQIFYLKRAMDLGENPNTVNIFLAKLYYRSGKKKECQKCFDEILKNNPTAEELVSYSRFLMKEGKIKDGYGLYRCRFETGHVTYPKLLLSEKRWDGRKDLTGKTVIVHYEQGFGDTVMFSRYIPAIAAKAGKVIFVVQKNLIPLFKSSGYEKYCTILSHEADVNPNIKLQSSNRSVMYSQGKGMGKIPHDFHIPLMDTPYLLEESPDKMREAGGYLMADTEKVKEYRKKYIKNNNKLKIGICYHGTKQSTVTYRDISIKKFLPVLKMKGIDFYSFQADEFARELNELPDNINIIDLGKDFQNFEDTACALNCMDLLITTDNVVMNLAGALGLKTYCLYNVYSESRWYKTEGEDIGWYKSVRPFRAKTFNDWDNLIVDVKNQIKKDFNI